VVGAALGSPIDSQEDVILVEREHNETVVHHAANAKNERVAERVARMEQETGRQFELLRLNYTRLLADLDGDLRAGRGLPRIVEKALRYFDLKQVVQEIETSVMSKVSCTACKAGENKPVDPLQLIVRRTTGVPTHNSPKFLD